MDNSSSSCGILERFTGIWLHVATTIASIFCIISIIGNGIIITAFVRTKSLQKPPNVLLTNLSLGDFLLALIGLPFYFWIDYYPDAFCDQVYGKFRIFVLSVFFFVSLNNIAIVALERFIGIQFPFYYASHMTIPKSYLMALGSWLFSIVRASVVAVQYSRGIHPDSVIQEVVIHFMVLLVTIISYCQVYTVSRRHLTRDKRFGIRKQQSKSQVAVIIALVNAFFWVPPILVRILSRFVDVYYWIQLTFLGPYIGTCFNLVIYTYRMSDYRAAVKRLINWNAPTGAPDAFLSIHVIGRDGNFDSTF